MFVTVTIEWLFFSLLTFVFFSCSDSPKTPPNHPSHIVCKQSEIFCQDKNLMKCSDDGKSTLVKEECVHGCDPLAKTCYQECKPTQQECDGTILKTCNPLSQLFESLDCNDNNPCTEDTCSVSVGCKNLPLNGSSCDDGLFCTIHDQCFDGTCTSSATQSCDDGIDCTEDSCSEEKKECQYVLKPKFCLIEATCHAQGDKDPQNSCKSCNFESSTNQFSNTDNIACNDNLFCTILDACLDGECHGQPRTCASGLACDEQNQTCSCQPGFTVCENTLLAKCNDDGSDFTAETCEFGCDDSSGASACNVCVPDSKTCNDPKNYKICNSDGDLYGADIPCAENLFCSTGECLPQFVSSFGGLSECKPYYHQSAEILFFCEGESMVLYNVLTKNNPHVIERISLKNTVQVFAYSQPNLFVGVKDIGVIIFDISTPNKPKQIGMYPLATSIHALLVNQNNLYVAASLEGIHIVDISNIAASAKLSIIEADTTIYDLALSGNIMALARGSKGIRLYDITNAVQPVVVSDYDSDNTSAWARGIALSGNIAYVAMGIAGLEIINIGNTAQPVRIGQLDTIGYAQGAVSTPSYLYIVDETGGIAIINTANSASPTLVSTVPSKDRTYGISIGNDYAFISDGFHGLIVANIANKSSPQVNTEEPTIGNARHISSNGNILYISDYRSGIAIYDITDIHAPQFLSQVDLEKYVRSSAYDNNYLYVANESYGLTIIDVTNPYVPVVKTSLPTPGQVYDVAIKGNYAYLADYSNGMVIVDIQNKETPVIKGTLNSFTGYIYGIAADSYYAYLAEYGYTDTVKGFHIISTITKTSPTLKSSITTSKSAYDIAINGNFAYLADGTGGLAVIDITSKTNPSLKGSLNTDSSSARSITIDGTTAYLANSSSGLYIADISQVATPAKLASLGFEKYVYHVFLHQDHALLSADSHGILIVKVK